MESVVEPSDAQVVPFDEIYPVKVLPVRTNFNQYGATGPAETALEVVPPVAARYWNVAPLEGLIATNTFLAFASSDSRIISPAFAHPLVFV